MRARWYWVGVGAGLCGALAAGWVFWRASRTLEGAARGVASEKAIRFSAQVLDRAAPAGFELVSAPAVFHDAAVFQGRLHVCGPGGLFVYSPEGALERVYRVGLDLPPAPLVRMSAGVVGEERQLWIGTSGEGLLSFDGRRFRQVRPEDAGFRAVTALAAASTGRLLVGTAKRGVLALDGARLERFPPSVGELEVTALAGSDSDLWIGTLDRGVLHWHAGRLDRFGEAEGLPDGQVLAIEAAGGAVFVGTALGVAEFRDGRFERVVGQGVFARALAARGDRLVAGTLEEGVVEIPLAARPARTARPHVQVLEAAVERLIELDGRLHALASNGLFSLEESGGPRRVLAGEEARLADRNISALAVDGAGKLWVGYFDRGLDILEAAGGKAAHLENEHLFCINRVVEDAARGLVAVATANGLVLLDPAGREREWLGREQGLIASHVTDIALIPGGMAVATPAGLTFLDGSGARSLYAFHGLVNNHVYALGAAGSRLLAGTLGGLSVLEGGVVRASYTTSNSSLGHNWITALARVGDDWYVGTYGAGVLKLDASLHWSRFADLPAGLEINPGALLATSRAVYAGSLGQGLYVFQQSAGRWPAVTGGLPSRNVTALAEHAGYLYIGTDNGLVRVPEQNLLHP